jgi:hypothetical protein
VQILGYVVTCGVKIMHFCHGWCSQPPQTASHIYIRHIQCDWAHWYAIHGHTVSALHSYTHPAWLRFWGSVSLVEMMLFTHGWGWQSPQTASHIHIWHAQSIWAHWYAVHWHMVAALHSFTHPSWVRFWGSGSLVESKWCDYVMVDTDGHCKLLPTSILDMCKVFEHIDMLSTCIKYQPYTVIPTLLGSDFGVLGHLWSQNDVIMSWLRLTATSNCFTNPY